VVARYFVVVEGGYWGEKSSLVFKKCCGEVDGVGGFAREGREMG
jgi:hypothetical protein